MHTNAFSSGLTFFRRQVVALLTVVAVVTGLLAITASATSATPIYADGLDEAHLRVGLVPHRQHGTLAQQNFDLGPSTDVGCNDAAENNDAAPLGTVG